MRIVVVRSLKENVVSDTIWNRMILAANVLAAPAAAVGMGWVFIVSPF